ncbi:hypothetical protein [Sphingomonas faeni]|uniref:hypothetical protein n=1 Tax=Sphingomonas faeni TaxID=185950 RepID=UPI0020C7817F|nr:hypothetical protein [Sphingomonas faeni]MCP8890855.1 hypothetical protein [Sphingomonas faeni]
MKAGKQWQERVLALEDVKLRPDFQLRAKGINRAHAAKLQLALEDGKVLPSVKVAAIGKALYLVDGFHRYAAHEALGSTGIKAQVARMTLKEAREEARLANATHGLSLSQADKLKVWEDFTGAGGHLDTLGSLKSSRVIAAEVDHVYSREAIRKKLKAMGLELAEGPEFKPWQRGDDADESDEALVSERVEEAELHLAAFERLFHSLPSDDQGALLGTARKLVEALESGEALKKLAEPAVFPLDI